MSEDPLWAAISRAASEAGRLARAAAEAAAKELSGALGKDQRRWPGSLRSGPVIPGPYKQPDQGLTWQDGYMASCVVSVARTVQQQGIQPATAALVALQAGLHFRPGGYRLLQVGLNAHRVLDRGEWRRLATAPLLHADLPHLASNATSLVLEGLPLERRLGTARFLALVASSGVLAQGLFLLSTKLAAVYLPDSSLANTYYLSYSMGSSAVAMALRVVAGYMREADLALARVAVTEEMALTAGRLGVWPSLLMSQVLVPGASLAGHMCGVAAGLLHVYGARGAACLWQLLRGRRRRVVRGGRLVGGPPPAAPLGLGIAAHPGLGWADLASQLVLGVGTCLAAHLAARSRSGRAR